MSILPELDFSFTSKVRKSSKKLESGPKGQLVEYLRKAFPSFVILRLEDRYTHGIPDVTIWGNRFASATEVKLANPDFDSNGIQELTMKRIKREAHSWYTVYYEVGKEKRTYIVPVNEIGNPVEEWTIYRSGFDHKFIADYVGEIHGKKPRAVIT